MTKKTSAGILLYRFRDELEVFLVHPGGPFWAKKDLGAWSLPKGEVGEGEDPLAAAIREFTEETGFRVEGEFRELRPVQQKGGKTVVAWAVEGDCDPAELRSNTFSIGSRQFPEVDRGEWFTVREARKRILAGQVALIDELESLTKP
jgi:predicted NUDIX family NTP pyrophosphohydrolase